MDIADVVGDRDVTSVVQCGDATDGECCLSLSFMAKIMNDTDDTDKVHVVASVYFI